MEEGVLEKCEREDQEIKRKKNEKKNVAKISRTMKRRIRKYRTRRRRSKTRERWEHGNETEEVEKGYVPKHPKRIIRLNTRMKQKRQFCCHAHQTITLSDSHSLSEISKDSAIPNYDKTIGLFKQ